jgi:hypothetical protein
MHPVALWSLQPPWAVHPKSGQAHSRQRVFNGHVRDSYAQLSAEVLPLWREVEELRTA